MWSQSLVAVEVFRSFLSILGNILFLHKDSRLGMHSLNNMMKNIIAGTPVGSLWYNVDYNVVDAVWPLYDGNSMGRFSAIDNSRKHLYFSKLQNSQHASGWKDFWITTSSKTSCNHIVFWGQSESITRYLSYLHTNNLVVINSLLVVINSCGCLLVVERQLISYLE